MPTHKQAKANLDDILGVFANAFRIVDATGDQCILEFLVYSNTENLAKVVGKVTVSKVLLPLIRDQIKEIL